MVDADTGRVLRQINLPGRYFGEGIVCYQGKLIQLTWTTATGFIYENIGNLQVPPFPREFCYQTTNNNEAWGITLNSERDEFIVTDGSNHLMYWNTTTFETLRVIPVFRQDGSPAERLNDVEFWRGRVIANVWKEDVLLVIHPDTGVVEKEYGMWDD